MRDHMRRQRLALLRTLVMAAVGFGAPVIISASQGDLFSQVALAETPDGAETKAFEDAKALGTPDAWNAFLAHYATGFHADLARAYLKQLTSKAPVPPPAAAVEQPATERACDEREGLKSRESREPAKLHVLNESGTTLILQWIDFDGKLKEYATLQPGADVTQDTYMTHPWIVAYQEGSCRQVFLPVPGTSVAHLRPDSELPKSNRPKPSRTVEDEKEPSKSSRKCPSGERFDPKRLDCVSIECGRHQVYRKSAGKCIDKADTCSKNEVYSSSMQQCISKAAMCSSNQVYSSSLGACVAKVQPQAVPPPKPQQPKAPACAYKTDGAGNCLTPQFLSCQKAFGACMKACGTSAGKCEAACESKYAGTCGD